MQTINLSVWDNLAIISYLFILLFIGYKAYKSTNQKDEKDFLLANRTLSLPAFVATLVTTWYGGILGIGEFTYLYGISSWIVFGLPYYIFAVLFALFLAHKVRKENQFTIADLFYNRYGKKVGLLSSVFLLFMTSPAPYILMLSVLLQLMFNFSLFTSLIVGTTISTIYIFFGGFRSVVKTDKLQFVLIYAGFLMLLIFLLIHYGDFQFLKQNLSHKHLVWHGGNSVQYMLVWFFLASWTFIDPGFHQRCAAAKNDSVAKKGILISVGFWFVFDFLTVSTGLYAAATLNNINPMMSYPLLAETILPPFLKGIFLVGLLAIIMSTIDSFTFLSAITFGRDIVWRLKNTPATEKINSYTRLGLFLTGFISIILCLAFPSVIKLWYVIGSLFIPPMLLPLLTGYFKRFYMPPSHTLFVMLFSFLISLSSFICGHIFSVNGFPTYPFHIEPFFPGLICSLLFYILWNSIRIFSNSK